MRQTQYISRPAANLTTTTGIGLAISNHLLTSSHKVLAIARSRPALEKLQQQYPSQVEILAGDLSDFSLGPKAAELVKSKFGKLDGLIVNHGVLEPVQKVGDAEVEEWRRLFDINVFSAVSIVSVEINLFSTDNDDLSQIDQSMPTSATRNQGKDCSLFFRRSNVQL